MPQKEEQINELLTRGIEQIIPSREALEQTLLSGRKLTVYLGIDPTGPHLHLGHSVPLLLLRRFQKLGNKIILLIGDFTARIGDPSGRTSQRKPMTAEAIKENLKTYKKQASPLISADEVRFNSEWLKKLNYGDLLKLASNFTVQQMLARDMFQERVKKELPIGLNEFLYPLAQGYDSVALKTDVEVGASDQLFNMLIGRDLVRAYLKREKFVLTTKLLVNPANGKKMSKSEGSFVALDDPAGAMYGKIMAFPDELIKDCFELCTEMPMAEVASIIKLPPRDAKAKLALSISAMYHGEEAAKNAEEEFNQVFKKDELPQNIPTVKVIKKSKNIVELLVETNLASSKSEARRLIEQGGVKIDSHVITDWREDIEIKDGMILAVGKRRIVKIGEVNL